jgi:predicted anti-sigma-YlaC factor YlaD
MNTATCIGEPISWLRLETFALDRSDAAVRDHIATCAACRQCLDSIADDMVALPPLVVSCR